MSRNNTDSIPTPLRVNGGELCILKVMGILLRRGFKWHHKQQGQQGGTLRHTVGIYEFVGGVRAVTHRTEAIQCGGILTRRITV
jgi:hypothetical protein